jgi:hypothetical protein
MDDAELAGGSVLAQGDTFIIHGAMRVVWSRVCVPRGLDPARGAAAGEVLGSYLLNHVLERRSPWLGVVFDVRDGPSVIGPTSLRVMESICDRAELVRRRLAILVGSNPLIKEQLVALVQARAPRFAVVTDDRGVALDWMTSSD